jgi:hypothetical protein
LKKEDYSRISASPLLVPEQLIWINVLLKSILLPRGGGRRARCTPLQYPGCLIATMRAKPKYVLQEVNGRQVPKKVGLGAVQHDGIAYKWDIVGEMDKENTLTITKTRCRALNGQTFASLARTWRS